GFGAVSLPADSGSGVIGDYPPAILSVSRSPLVPLASEGVTVTAEIGDEGAVTAQLLYSLDGVLQAPLAMAPAGGLSYAATIPAQLDGVRVAFRVEATDTVPQTEVSPAQGYFSGVTPIATLRINDADGVLVPKRYGARVEGVFTAEPGLFHPFITQAFLQDATGGVQVFDTELLAAGRGDRGQVVGLLEQFGGQTELNSSQNWGNLGFTFVGPDTVPAPQVVTVAGVDESVEGKLVRINGVTVVSGSIPETGSGSLEVSDDGGLTSLTVRIDGDTDLPGANTPTQPFDLIGIASQFDSFVPLTSGFQIQARERADFLTEEVNHAALIIHEIHADPDASQGDANGDSSVSSTEDEFVELVNTGTSSLDISGYTLADGIQVRHTFPAGTVVPAREAVVVFSGGTPTGDFGNAAANGLVFTASTGRLALNNAGDSVILSDDQGAVLQAVSYGGEGGDNQSLTRDPDFTNAPFVKHTVAVGSGGSRYSPGTRVNGSAFTVPPGAVILTEVMYDPNGADGGLEWVELYNTTGSAIDLADMSLGAGGGDYTSSQAQLSGTIGAGSTFVVGGPTSSADNGNPVYDLVLDFSPDLQNSGAVADGVALFNVRAASVTPSTVPVDAVV
ncbi:MAG: lamin tail domain-containing protein, partial [Acidobacteria bacterium]|nr:lamin tail domain-containing protein [Acidobacteriota bacterium]